jgi:multisubunit Na+/H+ antiporter MnhB subunit
MHSLILAATSRIFFGVMLITSFWILLRGHNEPGGGFIGGLIGAAAFITLALATDVEATRRKLRLHPVILMSAGLFMAFISGVPGIIIDASYLHHQWVTVPLGITDLKLGTTLVFDIGVYLVVIGGVLAFMFRLYEEVREG